MKQIITRYLILFLTVILFISFYIISSSFKTQVVQSKVSLYGVSANQLVGTIEDGLFYGKSLDNFYEMTALLHDWAEDNGDVVQIKIVDKSQKDTYYQLAKSTAYNNGVVDDSLMVEIREGSGVVQGYLNVSINIGKDYSEYTEMKKTFIQIGLMLLAMGTVVIVIYCRKKNLLDVEGQINKKHLLLFTITLVLTIQVAFTAYSYRVIADVYTDMSNRTVLKIQQLIQKDMDKITSAGIVYEDIYQFEDYVKDMTVRAPIIKDIQLEKTIEDMKTGKGGIKANVTLSQAYIKQQLLQLLLEMITAMAVTLFVAAEIVNLMILSILRKTSKTGLVVQYNKGMSIRVVSFIIHMACYLPVSFIPLMMDDITGGNASDLVLGLPTMAMFAAGFVATLLAGDLCIQYGWKKVLLGGVLLLIISSLSAALFQNAAVLVISRAIYGGAYALVAIGIREFAVSTQDREARAEGLAQSTAGLYAGINIGAVTGSMIITSMGFPGVFFVSVILGLLSVYLVRNYLVSPPEESQGYSRPEEDGERTGLLENLRRVFRDKRLVCLLLLISAPLAISVMFFEYFLPIYAVKAHISSSDIGRAFLINGIAVAYGAPFIMKYLSGKFSQLAHLFIFMMLMAAGFVLFGSWGSALSIVVASGVMGLAEGNALVSEGMIMLDLPAGKKIGTSRIMSFYSTFRKLVQTVGPQIFALFMLVGYEIGMSLFGITMAVCGVLYFGLERKKQRG